jgi:hypothetical protein
VEPRIDKVLQEVFIPEEPLVDSSPERDMDVRLHIVQLCFWAI